MNSNIRLPSGKIFDLNRFVALLPPDDSESDRYSLIFEGYSHAIYLDSSEADLIKQQLNLSSTSHNNGSWNREEQIRINQPKLKLYEILKCLLQIILSLAISYQLSATAPRGARAKL